MPVTKVYDILSGLACVWTNIQAIFNVHRKLLTISFLTVTNREEEQLGLQKKKTIQTDINLKQNAPKW